MKSGAKALYKKSLSRSRKKLITLVLSVLYLEFNYFFQSKIFEFKKNKKALNFDMKSFKLNHEKYQFNSRLIRYLILNLVNLILNIFWNKSYV